MASKEITPLSSAEDRYTAGQELQSANAELSQWIQAYKEDPNSPRDIYEGVDYGVFLTIGMVNDQARRIANQYDYIAYGKKSNFESFTDSGALNVQVGGDDFFIRGDGISQGTLSTANEIESGLTALSDASLSDSFVSNAPAAPNVSDTIDNPINTSPTTLLVPNIDTGVSLASGTTETAADILPQPTVSSSITSLNSGSTGNFSTSSNFPESATSADGVVPTFTSPTGVPNPGTVPNGLISIDDPDTLTIDNVTSVVTSTDDSGFVDTSSLDGVLGASGLESDPDREDVQTGSGEVTDSLEPFGGSGDAVSVGQTGQTSNEGNNQYYEPNVVDLPILPNVLHKYTNWTYNVGWYMLDPNSHESIVRNGGITNPKSELQNLMMRSGSTGRAGSLGKNGDYYIENLRFTTIFGQNSQTTKSSNNFDINFEVVEPYGVAFLSELIQLAQANGIDDHFDIPYLLEIKFKGYDDYGNIVNEIPDSGPKYIPIKIINITFKIVSGATIYNVQAVPYAHSPLQNQWNAFIHESTSLKGSTFEELMTSLMTYLNNSEENKAKEQSRVPDKFDFVIHDNDLKNSKVGFVHKQKGSTAQIDRISMADGEDTAEFVQITGGSTLKSAIQAIASATDFGARFNTVGQPESNADNVNKPYRLLKIIPVVTKLGEYNTSTKQYSKSIVYKIETQKMYGFVLPDMPGAKPTQRGWQKEYNWIFTGSNQDIVDFEADYNIQYFNIRNSFVNQKGLVTGTPSADQANLPDDGVTRTQAGGQVYSPAIVTASSSMADSVQNSYRGPAFQLAADHMDNVLNNPGADMISVSLKIIGDPHWIAQDKSILPTVNKSSGNDRLVNGSVAIDNHDVFFMLRFRTPRDYDPESGLMKIDTEQTFVQGLYRVITIESNFYDGKFEQTLRAIRVQDQVSNDPANIPDLTRGYRGIGWKSDSRDNSTSGTAPKPSSNVQVWDRLAEQRAEASSEITEFGQRSFPSAPFRPNVASPESEDLFNELNRGSNFPDQN